MNRTLKIILYIVFIAVAVGFGIAAKRNLRQATANERARAQRLDEGEGVENTNVVAESTNAATEVTNAAAEVTNAAAEITNAVAPRKRIASTDTITAGNTSVSYSRMISYGLLSAAGFIGFAFLFARDVSHLFAHKAEQALFSEDGAPVDPEYEHAEELWKDGKHLEAIQALREYLKKHPREQYVALRIAEIYEQNLYNPLAAALEYEEVLKENLTPERWGWAAIHLANIYSGKLNQPDKAITLLHRIDSEYGTTTAANKARERLLQIDPSFVPSAAATAPAASEPADEKSASHLPPGFRPKG
jgi:TolA-binding protein